MQLSELKENSFIYVGPSWAATSFGHEEPTNLLEQWKLSAVNYSQRGKRNLDFIRIPDYNIDRPCVWVFCEPLVELFKGVRNPQEGDRDYPGIASYLDSVDHRLHHSKLKRQQLEQMNNLGVPIGLIGSHCDVYESDIQGLENLSIIHPSWQQWMKDQCQLTDFTLNFGCDIANNNIEEGLSYVVSNRGKNNAIEQVTIAYRIQPETDTMVAYSDENLNSALNVDTTYEYTNTSFEE